MTGHPGADELLERRDDPEIAAHLNDCPRCRVQARALQRVRDTDPDTLPGIEGARSRLEEVQRQASVTLSESLGDPAGDDLTPGTEVDARYTVEGFVGRGGMGTVYRVRHNELGSVHALKVLNWMSPGIRGRLIREGQAQSRLRHPNVVPVTDVVNVGGTPGLIMELVEGPSLSEWLRREGRPSLEVADALAVGILRGVAAAHDAGLVHRDLKPSNVLLAPGDEGPIPKVTDFGLVRLVGPAEADTRLTVSDTPLGTPAYMAPEQLRDASTADVRSDVFSLGALLYELVTGRRAFDGVGWLEITDRVRAGRYDPPASVAPDLPARMAQTIERCLRVDPARRFPDVASVLAAWTADGAVAVSRQDGTGGARGLFVAAAALVLAVVVAGGAAWVATTGTDTPAPSAGGDPAVSANPVLQRDFELGWSAFLASEYDTAAEELSWAFTPDAERDTLLPTLVYAASLDFAGHRARAWTVLDAAAPVAARRQSRPATLLKLYAQTSYPQAPLVAWEGYLDAHPDDLLAFLLAARVSDGNPDLQRQYYERARALAPPGATVGRAAAAMVGARRALRSPPDDDALRSGAFYPGYVLVGGTSPVWDLDPASRWEMGIMLHREMVAATPEEPLGRYMLAVLEGLAGNETARQEQLPLLFGTTTNRLDRIRFARGDAWFEFGRGRWADARARLEQCEADASLVMESMEDGSSMFAEGALCADDRVEMALLLEDAAAAREALDDLRDWVSQPELPAGLGARMIPGLLYLQARIALLEGDGEQAEALRSRLVDGDYPHVRWSTGVEAALDLNWRLRSPDEPVPRRFHQERREHGCLWELGYGEASLSGGDVDEAVGVLDGIISGETCPDGPFVHGLFKARAHVLLAEAELARGREEPARAHLDAFEARWPLADGDNPLVVRAEAVATRLE